MNVGETNDSIIKNQLDAKYLTEFERGEIKKYKDVYYVGHKAHLRKVSRGARSTKTASGTRNTTTESSLATISATDSKPSGSSAREHSERSWK